MNLGVASVLFLITLSLRSHAVTPGGYRPLYSVSEIEILNAYDVAGQKYRIASISDAPEQIGEIVLGDKEVLGKDFGSNGFGRDLRTTKPGETKTSQGHFVTLTSLLSPEKIELKGVGNKEIKYRIRLLKVCPTSVSYRKRAKLKSKSYGNVTLPRLVEVDQTVIELPKCFEPSDMTFTLGAAALNEADKSEVEAAKKLTVAEDAERERRRLHSTYVNERVREYKKQAREYSKSLPTLKFEKTYADNLRQRLCPEAWGMAKFLGVKTIQAERKLLETTQHQGYTSRSFESSVTFRYANGKTDKFTHGLGNGKIVYAMDKLEIKDNGCFDAQVPESLQYSEWDLLDDTSKTLQKLLERELENKAWAEADIKFPPPPSPTAAP